ncbi:MAG: hypothetical protein ABI472_22335 [Ginsengibacter sp.]
MTNTEIKKVTNWWIIHADGSGTQQLTYFNDTSNPQYAGQPVWFGMGSFNVKGTEFFGGRM